MEMVLGDMSRGRYVEGRARLRRGEGRRSLRFGRRCQISFWAKDSDATGEAGSGFAAIPGSGAHQEPRRRTSRGQRAARCSHPPFPPSLPPSRGEIWRASRGEKTFVMVHVAREFSSFWVFKFLGQINQSGVDDRLQVPDGVRRLNIAHDGFATNIVSYAHARDETRTKSATVSQLASLALDGQHLDLEEKRAPGGIPQAGNPPAP